MILMIIFISLLVLAITFLVISLVFWDGCLDDAIPITCLTVIIFSGLAHIITVPMIIHANTEAVIKGKEYEYQEQIKILKNKKMILESYHSVLDEEKTSFTSDITFEKISRDDYYDEVSSYNKAVFEFKTDIKQAQYNLNNPWISWFVSPACLSVTDEMLDSLTYTVGK